MSAEGARRRRMNRCARALRREGTSVILLRFRGTPEAGGKYGLGQRKAHLSALWFGVGNARQAEPHTCIPHRDLLPLRGCHGGMERRRATVSPHQTPPRYRPRGQGGGRNCHESCLSGKGASLSRPALARLGDDGLVRSFPPRGPRFGRAERPDLIPAIRVGCYISCSGRSAARSASLARSGALQTRDRQERVLFLLGRSRISSAPRRPCGNIARAERARCTGSGTRGRHQRTWH
jgi:hypothetical protein